MDQASIDAFDDATRTALFHDLGLDPSRLEDLGGFESFVFADKDRGSILRVTHTSHRSLEQVTAELQWICFLAERGAAVCPPLRRPDGGIAVAWHDFVVCEFARAAGRTITASDWGTPLFARWGRSIAEFHRLTQQYEAPGERRPDCSQDENFDLEGLLPGNQPDVLAMARRYRNAFMDQSRTVRDFGLIHSDPHPGNFFYDGARLSFFDFDDACYCWFAYDIATLLLSAVLQPWIEESQAARQKAARQFLPAFLDGYARELDPPSTLVAQLNLGVKFREICLYGVICRFLPAAEWGWFETRFMAGRRRRIERDEPYLELDFIQ